MRNSVAVALLQAARFDDDVAEPGTGRDVDLDLLDLLRRLLFEQIFIGVQARLALGLPRARRHADPIQLALERPLPLALGLLFLREAVLLLFQPGRVVPFPRDPGAAIELENPAGDVVEEVAIVRHAHDGAGIVLEEPLEPRDRLGVEMVRRLVQQQEVRRLEKQPAQRHAAPLAAREFRDVGVSRRQPERVHRQLQPRVEVPRVGGFDLVLDLRLLVQDLIHLFW
jgi:hypothetical protein